MKRLGVRKAILPCTAPGACVLDGQLPYNLARELNLYAAGLRDQHPDKFGFFANLPSLLDTEAALAEPTFALDTLKADGLLIFTRYGHSNTYLGHPDIEPVWVELHRRKAVVFVHPTQQVGTTKVDSKLLQPRSEVLALSVFIHDMS